MSRKFISDVDLLNGVNMLEIMLSAVPQFKEIDFTQWEMLCHAAFLKLEVVKKNKEKMIIFPRKLVEAIRLLSQPLGSVQYPKKDLENDREDLLHFIFNQLSYFD